MKRIRLLFLIYMFTLLICGCAKTGENVEPIHEDLGLNIQDFYMTNAGDPSNLYYIDENNVLWGSGRNNCGQLGQGTRL